MQIEFAAQKFNSMSLDCVSGDFIMDMTPCAPAGKYALSYPTGSVSISRIVSRWQDYGGHLGGVVNNATSRTYISLSGGFMGSAGLSPQWIVTVDRITGEGRLTVYDDDGQNPKETKLDCRKVRPKL